MAEGTSKKWKRTRDKQEEYTAWLLKWNLALKNVSCSKKCVKRESVEGTEQQNQEGIRMLGKAKKLHVVGNIGSGHHQTSGNERKK